MSDQQLEHGASMWLQDWTWEQVRDYLERSDRILVPIGSTEQHGPAAPLGLDTYNAIALVADAASRAQVPAAPPIWYGDSSHHLAFPGTVSLRTETLMAIVADVSRCLVRHGFRKVVWVNGHKGANLPALTSALKTLHEEELPQAMFVVADPLTMGRRIARTVKEVEEHHAGELEVSQLLYKYPGLVRTDRLTEAYAEFEKAFGPYARKDLFGGGEVDGFDIIWNSREQRRFAPTGSFTPSKGTSVEKGRAYHEAMVTRLVELLEWLKNYQGPIGRE